jgi:hypothetical protein
MLTQNHAKLCKNNKTPTSCRFKEKPHFKNIFRNCPAAPHFISALVELHGRKFGEKATLPLSHPFAMNQSLFDPVAANAHMHCSHPAIRTKDIFTRPATPFKVFVLVPECVQ